MEPIFIDDGHLAFHNTTAIEERSNHEKNNSDWFCRLRTDAEECVLLLYDLEKYNEASRKLEHYLTKDLPGLETLVLSLLNVINTTGRAKHLFRKGIYEIIRTNIWKTRSPLIILLLEEIETLVKSLEDNSQIAELETCHAILSLIPEDQKTSRLIKENLHPEVTRKTPAKMVSLILQAYKQRKYLRKNAWFTYIVHIEELAEKVELEKKGLTEIKSYAYSHYHIDWKIMVVLFQRMLPIINNNQDKDLSANAYWSDMQREKSIKLSAFADPTLVVTRNARAPLLCERGRYSAVEFLIGIITKENQDIDIAKDASKQLDQFRKGELSPKIKELYVNFDASNLCPRIIKPTDISVILSNIRTAHTLLSDAEKTIKLKKMIAIFPSRLVPEEVINSVAKDLGVEKEVCDIFSIKNGLLLKDQALNTTLIQVSTEEEGLLAIELLAILKNRFNNYSQEVGTTKDLNSWAVCVHLMLKKVTVNFTRPMDSMLIQIAQELHRFFKETRSNSDNFFQYDKILLEHSRAAKEKKLAPLDPSNFCESLDDPSYQAYFNVWKENHNLDDIHVQRCSINLDGEYEFNFSVTEANGLKTLIKTRFFHHRIVIEIVERSSDRFEKKIKQIGLLPNKNAYIKVCETIDKMNHKEHPDDKDIFQVVHFFETVLMEGGVNLESISISAVFFATLFGFTKNNDSMGAPELNELNYILQRKLFISFLGQVYGKTHTEKLFKKAIEEALKTKSLILVPYAPNLPLEPHHRQMVIHFYNLVLTFSKHDNHEMLIQAFCTVLQNVRSMKNARLILYECSLALQKVFKLKNTSYYLTANRAAFFLREMRMTLFKIEILDLKTLIHTILSRISLNSTKDTLVNLIDIIESSNTLIPYIYTNEEIIQADSENIKASLKNIKSLANIILQNDDVFLSVSLFQKLCDLYILINHLGHDWNHFNSALPQIRSGLLNNSSVKSAIDTLDILRQSAFKFFILKGEHSDLLIHEISEYIDEMLSIYSTHRYFLFSAVRRIFPISSALWSTEAFGAFSRLVSAMVTLLYNKELSDIDSYIEILNITCRLKNSLKLNIFSQNINILYDQLSEIFIQQSEVLITTYLVPIWQRSSSTEPCADIGKILNRLSLEVQENDDFLKRIEYYYQQIVTHYQSNILDLHKILLSMKDRYNAAPTYKRLLPYLFKAYLTNGELFEMRWGYDTLSEIIDVPSGLITYLRLEDQKSNFLTALVTPIYMNNKQKVTGFGAGGKMKKKVNHHGTPNNPLMPLINVTDLTDTNFGKMLEVMTFKESYYYWQRMFHPILCDGSLLTGKFRVLYLDDNSVRFRCVTNADGCGFINAKILGKLHRNIRYQAPHSLRCPVQTHQAVHHNKTSVDEQLFHKATDELVVESCAAIEEYLSTSSNNQAGVRDLYSMITTGGIKDGRNFVVIPASDPKTFIIPLSLENSDVCLGKTPYEKLNDIIVKQEQELNHLKSADAQKRDNATYISSLYGFQHSFIATDGNKLIFNKGVLVIIPEEDWTYDNADIIFCRKDQKVNSTWDSSKKLPEHNEVETINGVLSVIQRYGPGSFAAISPDQQIDVLNADFDGDGIIVHIMRKGTHLFSLMKKTNELFTPYSTPKIQKSFTSSKLPNGQYSLFKYEYIMQARNANLLSFYSKIFDIYIALNHQYQLIVAKAIANMGILDMIIKHILVDESLDALQAQLTEKPNILIQRILSAGVKAGSDSFKSKVDWTYLREFANILNTIYDKLKIPHDLAYLKRLSINMHTERVDFEEVIARAKYQTKFFDSLPLHILYKTLSNTPKYKLDRLSLLLVSQQESSYTVQEFTEEPRKSKNYRKASRSHGINPFLLSNDLNRASRETHTNRTNKLPIPGGSALSTLEPSNTDNELTKPEPHFINSFPADQELISLKDSIRSTKDSSKILLLDTAKPPQTSTSDSLETPCVSEEVEYNKDLTLSPPLLLQPDEEDWHQQSFPVVNINSMPLNTYMIDNSQNNQMQGQVRPFTLHEKSTPITFPIRSVSALKFPIIKPSKWDFLSTQIQHILDIDYDKRLKALKSKAFLRNLFRLK